MAKGASVLATEAPSTLVVEDVSGNSQRFVVPPTPLVDAHADLVLQIVTTARALPAPSSECVAPRVHRQRAAAAADGRFSS